MIASQYSNTVVYFKDFYFMYMNVLSTNMHTLRVLAWCPWSLKRTLDPLELKLTMVVNHPVVL